ncbi:hypothetical protein LEP1GSC021_1833 [Leptospira noguchii str. 1993005606]|nr:hypothetical protein LEP1GSC021_1833 [Leptospira noguchii str. 1993005606]
MKNAGTHAKLCKMMWELTQIMILRTNPKILGTPLSKNSFHFLASKFTFFSSKTRFPSLKMSFSAHLYFML